MPVRPMAAPVTGKHTGDTDGVDDVTAALRQRYRRHEWRLVDTGQSGAGVWHLTGHPDLYVKIATRSAHPDSGFDLAAEADRLRWLGGTDIPTAEVVDAGDQDGTAWLVTTAIPGQSADGSWSTTQCAAAVDAIADLARTLHTLPPAGCPFDRRLATTVPHARHAAATGLVNLDDLDDEHHGWTATRLLAHLEATQPPTEDLAVCHGDLSLPNVLLDPGTMAVTGLVDVGRLGVADRYADLALITRDLTEPPYGPRHVDRFLARYGEPHTDPQRLAFYRLLDEFF